MAESDNPGVGDVYKYESVFLKKENDSPRLLNRFDDGQIYGLRRLFRVLYL